MANEINKLTDTEQAELLKNKFGVSEVNFIEKVQHYCPLGDQTGITTFEVKVFPNDNLAEMVALHREIQTMCGTVFTLESGARKVLDITKVHFKDASKIRVVSSCEPNRHMAANVVIEE